MMLLAEALHQLQIEAFAETTNFRNRHLFEAALSNFKEIVACRDEHKDWSFFQEQFNEFLENFDSFVKEGCSKNDQFKFWNVFLEDVVSASINLNRSHREGNWYLHIAAVRKAIPLFFFLH